MAALTPKQTQQIKDIHARFVAGTFSETDVHAALMLLRFHSGKGDVRDLGDSIAHPERDRGRFFDRMRHNQEVLNNRGKKSGVIDGGPIITANTFAANINQSFARLGLAELALPQCDLLLLCGLSLLQGGTMKANENGSVEFGSIFLELTADAFVLQASIPVAAHGKTVRAQFTVASVPNEWLPICNPRATIKPDGLVQVEVAAGVPIIRGFAPFMTYLERAPAIHDGDIAKLLTDEANLQRAESGLLYLAQSGKAMPLHYDGGRLLVPGLPEYFRAQGEFSDALKRIASRLGACVHDDSGAHWFLDELGMPPDGFQAHWIGRASATCTRPL
jgi:hypothetical protein